MLCDCCVSRIMSEGPEFLYQFEQTNINPLYVNDVNKKCLPECFLENIIKLDMFFSYKKTFENNFNM